MFISKAIRKEREEMTEEMIGLRAQMDEMKRAIWRGGKVGNDVICDLNRQWRKAGGLSETCIATFEELVGLPQAEVDKATIRMNRASAD